MDTAVSLSFTDGRGYSRLNVLNIISVDCVMNNRGRNYKARKRQPSEYQSDGLKLVTEWDNLPDAKKKEFNYIFQDWKNARP